jgi:HEAT repeat protein
MPFLFGQAPSSRTTQGANPPANASANATNPLIGLLKSPFEKVRVRAARDLGKAQDLSAIPALAEALSDPSEKVRREVVLALAQMHQSETLDALIKASQDTNEEICVLAVQSLVGCYTGTVPSPGFSGFVKKNWQRAKEHFNPDTTRIDPGLSVEPKVVAALDATLKSTRSNRASREAAKGLGILVARAAVPDLIKAAHSSDETLSLEALNSLSKIEDRSAGAQLVDLLDSPDKDIKQQSCVAIGILRTRQAAPKLESILQNDTDPKSKEKALEGLAYLIELARTHAFLPKLYPYLQSPNAEVRKRLCTVLMFSGDQTSLDQLDRLSHDPDGDVAAQALRAKRALRERLEATGTTPATGTH